MKLVIGVERVFERRMVVNVLVVEVAKYEAARERLCQTEPAVQTISIYLFLVQNSHNILFLINNLSVTIVEDIKICWNILCCSFASDLSVLVPLDSKGYGSRG